MLLLSEHVTSCAEKTFIRHIRYDNTVRPNTNKLFGPLFSTEANTNRIFGTSLIGTAHRHINIEYVTVKL